MNKEQRKYLCNRLDDLYHQHSLTLAADSNPKTPALTVKDYQKEIDAGRYKLVENLRWNETKIEVIFEIDDERLKAQKKRKEEIDKKKLKLARLVQQEKDKIILGDSSAMDVEALFEALIKKL